MPLGHERKQEENRNVGLRTDRMDPRIARIGWQSAGCGWRPEDVFHPRMLSVKSADCLRIAYRWSSPLVSARKERKLH